MQDRYLNEKQVHDDKKPSLSITYDGGKWLLHCFAGCSVKVILDEVGLDEKDLFKEL